MSTHFSDGVSRRTFLGGTGAAAAASAAARATGQPVRPAAATISGATEITLRVNGQALSTRVEPRTSLLEVLRYHFNLTGAKPVCLDGSSGACTVLLDGKPVSATTTLALNAVGKEITTCESLRDDPVVRAFVEHDAQQCGFCTPGFVVAVKAFLVRHPQATEEQIRAGLNGNLCRCGTYANVLQAAISLVKEQSNG